jgi:hypothetical protein
MRKLFLTTARRRSIRRVRIEDYWDRRGGFGAPTWARHGLALAMLLMTVDASWAEAQDSADAGPPIEALRLAEGQSIDLDGLLAEDFWTAATAVSDFTQQEPVEGATPSQETEVRILFDAGNLYIGVMLYDDPEGIIANQRERDAFLWSDDRFAWVLDTFKNGRTGYNFEVNPAGAMSDGLISGTGGGHGGGGGGGGLPGDSTTAGPWRSGFRSARSTSIRRRTRGASTSSAPSSGGTRRSSGADSGGTRGSTVS